MSAPCDWCAPWPARAATPSGSESAVSRTFYIWALLAAGISLATTRMIENIFPTSAHPGRPAATPRGRAQCRHGFVGDR